MIFHSDHVPAYIPAPEEKGQKDQGDARRAAGGPQRGHDRGISGKVINIKDDEVTIESGVERAKINVKKWGIKEVIKAGGILSGRFYSCLYRNMYIVGKSVYR